MAIDPETFAASRAGVFAAGDAATGTSFVIEAERLKAENVYQLSVEHAVLDTGVEHGVVDFATFATTTFLQIRTTGEASPGEACRSIRKNFDAGQKVL